MATRKRATALAPDEVAPEAEHEAQTTPVAEPSVTCGLVMPISAIDGCSADHWVEVKSILVDAIEGIEEPKFSVRLMSDADDVGVIQK